MSNLGTHPSVSPLEGYNYQPSGNKVPPPLDSSSYPTLCDVAERTEGHLVEIEAILRGIIRAIAGPIHMEEDSDGSVSCLNDKVMANLDKAQTINRLAYQLTQLIG